MLIFQTQDILLNFCECVNNLAYRMFGPEKPVPPASSSATEASNPSSTAAFNADLRLALLLAAPISVFAGMLGVPDFCCYPPSSLSDLNPNARRQ
jgi:hypothetical protein